MAVPFLRLQFSSHLVTSHFSFPPADHHRCHAIANHVGYGPAFTHEPVDANDESNGSGRNVRHRLQRRRQGHKPRPGHPAGTLAGQHRHQQQTNLLGPCHGSVGCLGKKNCRHTQVNIGPIHIEAVTCGQDEPHGRWLATQPPAFFHHAGQGCFTRTGAKAQNQLVPDEPQILKNGKICGSQTYHHTLNYFFTILLKIAIMQDFLKLIKSLCFFTQV